MYKNIVEIIGGDQVLITDKMQTYHPKIYHFLNTHIYYITNIVKNSKRIRT